MKRRKDNSDVQGKAKKKPKKRLPRWADRLITVLVILFGVALMVWPWVLDRIEASGVLNQISTVSSTVDAMDQEQKDYYLSEARAYNEVLAGQTDRKSVV